MWAMYFNKQEDANQVPMFPGYSNNKWQFPDIYTIGVQFSATSNQNF
jgi:hypothetical protein